MKLENKAPGAGRLIFGCLLGVVLAVFAPVLVLTELFSLTMVVFFPAIALMLLYRWAGLVPALLSAMLQMSLTARMLGGAFVWMAFFTGLLPLILLVRCENKPFFTQMKVSIAAFGGGVVLSVMVIYLNYGGNMIERVLTELPRAMRQIPADMLAPAMENLGAALGRELAMEDFYKLFDDMVSTLIPVYQVNLPGLLFSGALVSAVLCTGLSSLMLKKQGRATEGAYLPLRRWALNASTTSGLLMMTAVSLIAYLAGMQQGQALFYTVYNIAAAAFCVQALSSMARHMYASRLKKGTQVFILIAISALCLMGASIYVALYGCTSAIMGRYGALRQRQEGYNSRNNNHSDDEHRR